MVLVTVADNWGAAWRADSKIRNPYARTRQQSIVILWVGALALSAALARGDYAGIWGVSLGVAVFACFWGILFGIARVIGWAESRPQWVSRAIWWPIGLFVVWLVIIGLAADAQPDAPIVPLRNVIAPWHWDEV